MKTAFYIVFMHLCVFAQAGVPIEGLPTWEERTLYTLINSARLNPPEYGDKYCQNSNPLSSFDRREPYIMNHDLNLAAHIHSEDMGSCNRMSHNSCDGTSAKNRVLSFYDNYYGECIAHYYKTPVQALDAWLHSNKGHRDMVMSSRAEVIGCGHAKTSKHWWTTDYGKNVTPEPENPLWGGTHRFPAEGRISFLVNYFSSSNNEPKSVSLVLEGKTVALDNFFGKSTNTTFGTEMGATKRCRNYHFESIDGNGQNWRYPEEGGFLTYKEGGCTKNYTSTVVTLNFGYRIHSSDHLNGTHGLFSGKRMEMFTPHGRCIYRGRVDSDTYHLNVKGFYIKNRHSKGIFIVFFAYDAGKRHALLHLNDNANLSKLK